MMNTIKPSTAVRVKEGAYEGDLYGLKVGDVLVTSDYSLSSVWASREANPHISWDNEEWADVEQFCLAIDLIQFNKDFEIVQNPELGAV